MGDAWSYIGIDGCPAGWFCVSLAADVEGDEPGRFELAADARAMGARLRHAAHALIDIPIGLPQAGTTGRDCDRAARRLLGRPRAASVFAAPARATLAAKDYRQALALNRAATGRGISRQTWNILPKIRAIDTLLRESPALRDVLQECHPEVCFQVLNDGRPMQHNKQTAAGRLQRLAVLQRHLPQCQALYEQACEAYPRRELARDDILDALVCALTARLGSAAFRRLPDDPPLDGCGLPMQIVYCAPQAG